MAIIVQLNPMRNIIRKFRKSIKNSPNILMGYNIYVNPEKFALIRAVFNQYMRDAKTFADLGGVWKVDAAYTIYTLKNFPIKKAFIVDTNFNNRVDKRLSRYNNLTKIKGDFGRGEIVSQIRDVDIIYFFDVLLHQVNPNWDEILEMYSKICRCFIIFNQQYIGSDNTIRLTNLSLEEYENLAPKRSDDLYDFVFKHKNEINTEYNKPWKDVHNIWQWGITDSDLRNKLKSLGYTEKYYKNYGRFSNLEFFEEHAFIFLKE